MQSSTRWHRSVALGVVGAARDGAGAASGRTGWRFRRSSRRSIFEVDPALPSSSYSATSTFPHRWRGLEAMPSIADRIAAMNSGQPPPGSSSRRSGRFSGRLSGRAKKGAESPKKLNLDAAANAQTSPRRSSIW